MIVGCGPAGLSASLTARDAGVRSVTVEREDVGGTVRHYPRKKLVLTRPVKVPGYGKLNVREVTKEDLIGTWEEIVRSVGLEVATGVFRAMMDVALVNQGPVTILLDSRKQF